MSEVVIKPVAFEDLGWLLDLREKVREYVGDSDIPGTEKQKEWFAGIKNDLSVRYFIVWIDGCKVGIIRITQIDMINRSACVGGDIHPEFQGKGYGMKMMEAVKKYCFEVLNLRRLWLLVLDTNKRAKHLYKKSGFEVEGYQREAIWRGGSYINYVMMSFLRRELK